MEIPKYFEKATADFLHPQLGESPFQLYRYDKLSDRFYFDFQDGRPHTYISVTSLASKVIPMGSQFDQWLMSNGKAAMYEKTEKAIFGTLFHREAMKPIHGKDDIHGRGYDFGWLDKETQFSYFDEDGKSRRCTNFHMMVPHEWRHKASSWKYAFKRGLLSWFAFLKDKVTAVYAVEYPLACRKRNVGLTIDLVHGTKFYGKDVIGITDIKSFLYTELNDKRKSFYDTNAFQLEVQKDIWNEYYREVAEVTHLFNWSPKDWRKHPKDWGVNYQPYTWKNQTKNDFSNTRSFMGTKMKGTDLLIAYANTMGYIKPPTSVSDIVGSVEDISVFNPVDHVHTFDLIAKIEEETNN